MADLTSRIPDQESRFGGNSIKISKDSLRRVALEMSKSSLKNGLSLGAVFLLGAAYVEMSQAGPDPYEMGKAVQDTVGNLTDKYFAPYFLGLVGLSLPSVALRASTMISNAFTKVKAFYLEVCERGVQEAGIDTSKLDRSQALTSDNDRLALIVAQNGEAALGLPSQMWKRFKRISGDRVEVVASEEITTFLAMVDDAPRSCLIKVAPGIFHFHDYQNNFKVRNQTAANIEEICKLYSDFEESIERMEVNGSNFTVLLTDGRGTIGTSLEDLQNYLESELSQVMRPPF